MKDGDTCSAVGDVVEAVRDVVLRQQLVGVDVDRQQIPNGVRIFLAIEPVQHDLIRDVRLTCRTVERRLRARSTSESTAAAFGLLARRAAA